MIAGTTEGGHDYEIEAKCVKRRVLVDYEAEDSSEVDVKEGQLVKVYKRYASWSYVSREDNGERGWVPSWYLSGATDSE